jgi:hypothetical protein
MYEVEKKEVYAFQPGLSPVTAKIIDRLKDGNVGDIVTDEELQACCGRDTRPNQNGYGNLATALKRLERIHGKVWLRVKGSDCLKCCDSIEIANTCDNDIQRVRRRTKRLNRRASLVDVESLKPDDAKRFMANCAISGTIGLLSQTSTAKKLMARNTDKPIELPKLLEAFKAVTN